MNANPRAFFSRQITKFTIFNQDIQRLFQIDTTAIVGSFFPEVEDLICWLYRGGRKETNDVIISWCKDILQTRRKMQLPDGKHTTFSRNNMGQKCEGNCGLWVLNEIIKKNILKI